MLLAGLLATGETCVGADDDDVTTPEVTDEDTTAEDTTAEPKPETEGDETPEPVNTVIVNDPTPPSPNCELLIRNAFSECRDGFWHMVTVSWYSCPDSDEPVSKETHVIKSIHPCKGGDAPPSAEVGAVLPIGVPTDPPCASSQATGEVLWLWVCANGVWELREHVVMVCEDGRRHLLPGVEVKTPRVAVPCTDPPPSVKSLIE